MLAVLLVAATGLAAPTERPITIGISGGGMAMTDLSGGGHFRARARLNIRRFGIELNFIEGFALGDNRSVGGLGVAGRYTFKPGIYARIGFVHHHEVPFEALADDPFLAVIGSSEGIRHRSGGELALGWEWTFPGLRTDQLRHGVDLSVSAFPDDEGPPVYLMAEYGFSVDLGKRRRPKAHIIKEPAQPHGVPEASPDRPQQIRP